ncbi:hypothetical protein DCS_03190 [Drechmeria coniospora]|uniref:DUF7371 domain-containing protein n=1 Tax=Drechmeria coniospora TaxID=98403 RepID=A0A151GY72_DRECN|nr:hypothetical protein DCS_03190 [Drechmeria coniospora]KYK62045.1 hypothetical protein DCS_03190 [Drechmeria coniospora]
MRSATTFGVVVAATLMPHVIAQAPSYGQGSFIPSIDIVLTGSSSPDGSGSDTEQSSQPEGPWNGDANSNLGNVPGGASGGPTCVMEGTTTVFVTVYPSRATPTGNGSSAGGPSPGSSPPGGSLPGGPLPGGSLPGGSSPGSSSSGGSSSGGPFPGGSFPGGSSPGGTVPGGNSPGGNSPGGSSPGGSSPYGSSPAGSGSNQVSNANYPTITIRVSPFISAQTIQTFPSPFTTLTIDIWGDGSASGLPIGPPSDESPAIGPGGYDGHNGFPASNPVSVSVASPSGTGLAAGANGPPQGSVNAPITPGLPQNGSPQNGSPQNGSPWYTVVTDSSIQWVQGSAGPSPVAVLSAHTITLGTGAANAPGSNSGNLNGGSALACITTTGPDGRPTVFEWPAGNSQVNGGQPLSISAGLATNFPLRGSPTVNSPWPGVTGSDANAVPFPGRSGLGVTGTAYTVVGTDGISTVVHYSWVIPPYNPTGVSAALPTTAPVPVQNPNGGFLPGGTNSNGAGYTVCTSYTVLGADGKPTVVESTLVLPGAESTQAGVSGSPINGIPVQVSVPGTPPNGVPIPVTSVPGSPGPVVSDLSGALVTSTTYIVLGADGRPTIVDTTFIVPGPVATGASPQIGGITGAPQPGNAGSGANAGLGGNAGAGGTTTCITYTVLGADGRPTVVDTTFLIPGAAATAADNAPVGVFTGVPSQATGIPGIPQPGNSGPEGNAGSEGIATCISYTVLGADGRPTVMDTTFLIPGPAATPAGNAPVGVITVAPTQGTGNPGIPPPANAGTGSNGGLGDNGGLGGITTCVTYTALGPDGRPTLFDTTFVIPVPVPTPADSTPVGVITAVPSQFPGFPQSGNAGFGGLSTCVTYTAVGADGRPTIVESTVVIAASNARPTASGLGFPPGPLPLSNLPQGNSPFATAGSPITTAVTVDILGPNGVATPVVETIILTPDNGVAPASRAGPTLGFPTVAPQQTPTVPQGVPYFTSLVLGVTTLVTVDVMGPNGVGTPVVQTIVLTPGAASIPTAGPGADGGNLAAPPGPFAQGASVSSISIGVPSLDAYGPEQPNLQTVFPPAPAFSGLDSLRTETLAGASTSTVTIVAGPGGVPLGSVVIGQPIQSYSRSGGNGISVLVPGQSAGNGYPWGFSQDGAAYGSPSSSILPQAAASTIQTGTWTNVIPEQTTTHTLNFPFTTLATVAAPKRRAFRRQEGPMRLTSWSNATTSLPESTSLGASVSPPLVDETAPPSVVSTTPVATSSTPSATPSVGAAMCPSGGKIGNTTVDFDDAKPGPLLNPSRDLWFSQGFLVAPPSSPATQSYVPSSGGQLVEFVPSSLSGMPSVRSGDVAEVGVGPNSANPCFRFDFFSAELGCAAEGNEQWCEFEVSAYTYNEGSSSEQSIAWSEVKRVPSCPNFPSGNCSLTPVDFEGYNNITSILIRLHVGLELRAWWGDDFKFGWADNSCDASSCRGRALPQRARRETVESALRDGVWHWTPAGFQRLADEYIWESVY